MKKVLLTVLVAFAGFTMSAQQFNAGLSASLPSGDAGDLYTFGIALDANYLWEVGESFNVGGATGLLYTFGDSVGSGEFAFDIEDSGFIPVAAAARYSITEDFIVGADVGYAIGVAPSEAESGFYYAPRAQYMFTDNLSGVVAYRGMDVDGFAFNLITFGVEIKL